MQLCTTLFFLHNLRVKISFKIIISTTRIFSEIRKNMEYNLQILEVRKYKDLKKEQENICI